MAKLKRFSFSAKSNQTPEIISASAVTIPASSSSVWLGGAPPLIFEDHIGGAALSPSAVESLTVASNGGENATAWQTIDDGTDSSSASDQLDELRMQGTGIAGVAADQASADGDGDDNGNGKVVVRGCIGDVRLKLVDDSGAGNIGVGCSAEVTRELFLSCCDLRDFVILLRLESFCYLVVT